MSSFCSGCGTSMAEGEVVCTNCGRDASLNAPTIPVLDPQVAFGLPPESSGKAIFSLVCGTGVLVVPLLFFVGVATGGSRAFYAAMAGFSVLSGPIALVAVIFGHLSRFEIRRSAGRLKGGGIGLAGLVLGYCEVVVAAALITVGIIQIQKEQRILAKGQTQTKTLTPIVTTNQPTAVSAVRSVNTAEIAYAQAHPAIGYTCSIFDLSQAWGIKGDLDRIRTNDYAIKVQGCTAAKTGAPMTKYQVVAYPAPTSKAKLPAFCSDQSDTIKVDWNGSPEGCLSKGVDWNGAEVNHPRGTTQSKSP